MSRPPAFQFYAKDWLASSFVRQLARNLRATYFDLICYQAIDDGLPGDPKAIRMLTGLGKREWEKAWQILEPKFPLSPDGKRRNPKQDQVMRDRAEFIESKRAAGNKGAMKRWNKDDSANSKDVTDPIAQPMANAWPASSSSSASEDLESKEPTYLPALGVGTDSGASAAPPNGGTPPHPTPVGDFSLLRFEPQNQPIAEPDAVHRLVAAGVDSQVADQLVAKQAEARRRIGGGA